MIDLNDVEMKTPALEDFLKEIAKETGAKKAILFDGSIVNLVNGDQVSD